MTRFVKLNFYIFDDIYKIKFLHKIDCRTYKKYKSIFDTSFNMQTRSQSTSSTVNTLDNTRRNYGTRLQNRMLKLNVIPTSSYNSTAPSNSKGPAYNTRLAHNVLSPKSYCLQSEIRNAIVPPSNHRYNTRYRTKFSKTYNVEIDFDESSREWNRNKRRVGQMYEYTD